MVPSAELLVLQGRRNQTPGLHKPNKATAILVPRETETETGRRESSAFRSIADHLSSLLPTQTLENGNADLNHLQDLPLEARVVLFAAHGCFNAKDPLGGSGIYLAHEGCLPGENRSDLRGHLLTPQKLAQIGLDDSHVALLACVSGETTQITSREALGMIWAVLGAGAASIMAAAWKVNLDTASALVKETYANWLGEKLPLWQAHQAAMRNMMAKGQKWSHPYHWAPLVLYGYWE